MNNQVPARKLKQNRGLIKLLLLSIVTLGIYPFVTYCKISSEINLVASPRDGKKTMHYALLTFIFVPITLGIAELVWYNRICKRIGKELKARGINYKFGSGTFWFWNILGSLFGGVGPLIFTHKFLKAMNKINANYNTYGYALPGSTDQQQQ